MKKILAIVMALVLVLSFASCGGNITETSSTPDTSSTETVTGKTSLDVLNDLWAAYPDEDKYVVAEEGMEPFSPYVEPMAFEYEAVEEIDNFLGFPVAEAGKIKNVAYFMHMMNANSFTCAAYQLEGADMTAVANAIKDNIMNRQWMCGFPERLYVVSVGDVIVYAFGLAGYSDVQGDFMTNFVENVGTLAGVNVLVDTPIEVR